MEKKSFLIYFDMYPHIVGLPPAQRGALLSALFEYADAEWKEAGSGEQVDHPEMTPETRMAFRFMKETIRRDTEKWREKHQRYQDAARRRWDEKGADPPAWAAKGDAPKRGDQRPSRPGRTGMQSMDRDEAWRYID